MLQGKNTYLCSMRHIKYLILLFLAGCGQGPQQGFTAREEQIIRQQDSLLYVTVMPLDSAVLRTPTADFGPAELRSPLLDELMAKMLYTLRDPSQDGVGIAAPQVGIGRRLIWVQRLDKAGEPFECYLNIQVDSLLGDTVRGPEGCLSLPGLRGLVRRREVACVSYISAASLAHWRDMGADPGLMPDRISERIEGFTAIIFQHECDHLDGVLYIDRADSVFTNAAWLAERAAYDYSRPTWW